VGHVFGVRECKVLSASLGAGRRGSGGGIDIDVGRWRFRRLLLRYSTSAYCGRCWLRCGLCEL
jgi:hypothetical protein